MVLAVVERMQMVKFTLLPDRAVLTVAGEDRHSFLQGLITNDTKKLTGDQALFAAFLTAQGKYLHDFILAAHGDVLLLDGEAARLDDLRRRLSLYRLRAKVSLDWAERPWQVAAIWGGGAAAALGLGEGAVGQARPFPGGGLAMIDPRLAELGGRVLSQDDPTDRLMAAGCQPASPEDWRRHRMGLGVPEGSGDLPPEKTFLLENGFDELNAIDWKKGCYLGQELTARTKYRALIKKRLLPVRLPGAAPMVGTPVLRDGKDVGEIRSTIADGDDTMALAMLSLESAAADITADGRPLNVQTPGWMVLPKG